MATKIAQEKTNQSSYLPSYIIAGAQMRDVIRSQSIIANRLKCMVQRQEQCVTKDEYDNLMSELKDEKLQHLKTKARADGENEKLRFALSELDIVKKQLQREKKAYSVLLEKLRYKATTEGQQRSELADKCLELEKVHTLQEDELLSRDMEVKDLRTRLSKQRDHHRQRVADMAIHLQQERYMADNYKNDKRKNNYLTTMK